MKERGMLFSGPMVKAILEGRKTQTRRVIKPQPNPIEPNRWFDRQGPENYWVSWDERQPAPPSKQVWIKSPYGRPGDRLWVRETWSCERWENIDGGEGWRKETLLYRADEEHSGPWSPSIHMPKWATRIWLRITDVRIERIDEISSEDAIAEGIEESLDPRVAFRALWDSINSRRGHGWDKNPWIWAITFERKEKHDRE